jgi:ribosome-binding factor A
MTTRQEKVQELLKEEISEILRREFKDPRLGFITVIDTEVTPDLRHARVWVSVIGGAPERAETLAALERAMGFVRHELGVRLRIKRIPALHVTLDDSAERGTRVLRIIEELGQGHDSAGEALAAAPRSETLPTPLPRLRREGDAEPNGGEEAPPAGEATPVVGKPGPRRPARRAGGRQPKPRGRGPAPRRGDR